MIRRALAGALLAASLATTPVSASLVPPTPPPPVAGDPLPPVESDSESVLLAVLAGGVAGSLGAQILLGRCRRRR